MMNKTLKTIFFKDEYYWFSLLLQAQRCLGSDAVTKQGPFTCYKPLPPLVVQGEVGSGARSPGLFTEHTRLSEVGNWPPFPNDKILEIFVTHNIFAYKF